MARKLAKLAVKCRTEEQAALPESFDRAELAQLRALFKGM